MQWTPTSKSLTKTSPLHLIHELLINQAQNKSAQAKTQSRPKNKNKKTKKRKINHQRKKIGKISENPKSKLINFSPLQN